MSGVTERASPGGARAALTPLRLDEDRLLRERIARDAAGLAACALPVLSVWRDLFRYYGLDLDGSYCVFAEYDGNYYMPLPPLGSGLLESAAGECFRLMEALSADRRAARIENVPAGMKAAFEGWGYRVRSAAPEYCYRREDLARLAGNRYKSKRWAINRFLRQNRPVYGPYRSEDANECLDLLADWRRARAAKFSDDYYLALLKDAVPAHSQALHHHDRIGLTGRVVRIDGRIAAYTFGFEVDPATYCVLFEISDLAIPGLAQYLFHRVCLEMDGYRWINCLDDSGLENLKRTKRSYRPDHLIAVHHVCRR